jgi:hypothetical protein
MSKLGSPVSPLDVVVNGSHSMHAVDDAGVSVRGYGSRYSWEQLTIRCAAALTLQESHHRHAHASGRSFMAASLARCMQGLIPCQGSVMLRFAD